MTTYDKKKKAIMKLLNNIKSQVKNDQLDEDELNEFYEENNQKADGDFDENHKIDDLFLYGDDE